MMTMMAIMTISVSTVMFLSLVFVLSCSLRTTISISVLLYYCNQLLRSIFTVTFMIILKMKSSCLKPPHRQFDQCWEPGTHDLDPTTPSPESRLW